MNNNDTKNQEFLLDFSVIVCCYNPDFEKLKKTIISIYKQKDVKYEIIISDDGSKENYRDKLKLWADSNNIELKLNFLEKNVGTVKNIISGVEVSNGKYIKTISPGDYLFDEYSLKKYLDAFKTENCSLIFSDAVYYNEDKILYNKVNPRFTSSRIDKNIKRNLCYYFDYYLGASEAFARYMVKYLYEISENNIIYLEDFPLAYLSIINGEKVHFIQDDLVWYEYGTGLSTTKDMRIKIDFNNFYQYLSVKYSSNKTVKKTLKIVKIKNWKTNFLKIIVLFFIIPKCISLRIINKIIKKKINRNIEIVKLKHITNFEEK